MNTRFFRRMACGLPIHALCRGCLERARDSRCPMTKHSLIGNDPRATICWHRFLGLWTFRGCIAVASCATGQYADRPRFSLSNILKQRARRPVRLSTRPSGLPGRGSSPQGGGYLLRESIVPQGIVTVRRSADFVHQTGLQFEPEQISVSRLPARGFVPQGGVKRVRSHKGVGFALSIGPIARPPVFCRVHDDPGADGVQFDLALTGPQVSLFLCQTGTISIFPQRSAAAVGTVYVLNVALAQGFHQRAHRVCSLGADQ